MKEFLKKAAQWVKDAFQAGKLRKALDAAIIELDELRAAIIDFAEQIDDYETKIKKYKKQIKEIKAKIKEQESEDK